MKRSIDIYSRVGSTCPDYCPESFCVKKYPAQDTADCRRCRNFLTSQKRCAVDMFDEVIDGLFGENIPRRKE